MKMKSMLLLATLLLPLVPSLTQAEGVMPPIS